MKQKKYTSVFPLREGEAEREAVRRRWEREVTGWHIFCFFFFLQEDRNVPLWLQWLWLIVNSEVNWVERRVLILDFTNVSNKTTFLIWNEKLNFAVLISAISSQYQQWLYLLVLPSSCLVNYVKILLRPHCFFGIVHICLIVIGHTVYNMSLTCLCIPMFLHDFSDTNPLLVFNLLFYQHMFFFCCFLYPFFSRI